MSDPATTRQPRFYQHIAVLLGIVLTCGCGNNDAPRARAIQRDAQTKELEHIGDKRTPCVKERDLDVIAAVLAEMATFHPHDRGVLHSPTLNLDQISSDQEWIQSVSMRIAEIGGKPLVDSFARRNRGSCDLTSHTLAQTGFVLRDEEFPANEFAGNSVEEMVKAGAEESHGTQTLHVSMTMPAYSDSSAIAVVYVIHRLRNVFGSYREELLVLKRLGEPSEWEVVERELLSLE